MSSRLGIRRLSSSCSRSVSTSIALSDSLSPVLEDHVAEAVEQVVGVVRSGGGLRVVLHRERGDVERVEPFDNTVAIRKLAKGCT